MLDVMQTAVVVMAMLMIVMMLVLVLMVMVSTFMFVAVVSIIVTMVVLMFMFIAMFVMMLVLVAVFMFMLMVVMVVMMLIALLFTINHYCHMRSCNPTLYRLLSLILYAWDSKLIQFFHKFLWFWDELKECRTQHISSCSHSAIDI